MIVQTFIPFSSMIFWETSPPLNILGLSDEIQTWEIEDLDQKVYLTYVCVYVSWEDGGGRWDSYDPAKCYNHYGVFLEKSSIFLDVS